MKIFFYHRFKYTLRGILPALLCLSFHSAFAQPAVLQSKIVSGITASYDLNVISAPFSFRQVRVRATSSAASGARDWVFGCGTAASPTFTTNWRPVTSGQTLALNTYIPVSSATGAQYNTSSAGVNGQLPAITSLNYYTFNVGSNTASDNIMSVLETNFNPAAITSVTQSQPAALSTTTMTITVTMSAAPAAGERVIIRYSTNNFVASSFVTCSFSGATGTAVIPAQAAGSTVKYYAYSTNKTGNAVNGDVVVYGQTGHEMSTLNLNNNGGSYYSYPVYGNPVLVISTGGSFPVTTYSTLAAAVTGINGGVNHTGTINCYVNSGYTETAPVGGYSITATGGSATPIIFQKTGAGADPVLTAFSPQASGLFSDAVFKIAGGDYITIQNFSIQENAANTTLASATNNMTEMGIGIFHSSATNGAQNNTIQNNTISMSAAYQNAIGIFSTSSSTSTNATLAATSTAGTNSNNNFYGNTISNVANGIYLVCGPVVSGNFENGNDIGGSAVATANTITFGNAGTPSLTFNNFNTAKTGGVVYVNGANYNCSYNIITSNNLNYSTQVSGIDITGTAPSVVSFTFTANDNTVTLVSQSSGAADLIGINYEYAAGNSTISCLENRVTVSKTAATIQGSAVAIFIRSALSAVINDNTVVVNQTSSPSVANNNTGQEGGIFMGASSANSTVSGNAVTLNQTGSPVAAVISLWTATVYGIAAGSAPDISIQSNIISLHQVAAMAVAGTVRFINSSIRGITEDGSSNTATIGGSGSSNEITIQQDASATGTTTSSANFNLIEITNTNNTLNITNNILNTSGSGIFSSGTFNGIYQFPAISATVLTNIKNNSGTINRTAPSGAVSFININAAPADTVSANSFSFTGIAGFSTVIGINDASGNTTTQKDINNNTINISGNTTGDVSGMAIGNGFGNMKGNTINLSTSSSSWMYGIDAGANTSGAGAYTVSGNSFSLASNTTSSLFYIFGFDGGPAATGPFQIFNNNFNILSSGGGTANGFIRGIANSVAPSPGTNIYSNSFNSLSSSGNGTGSIGIEAIRIDDGGVLTNVFSNEITGINASAGTGSGRRTATGIEVQTGTTVNIYKNKIYDLSISSTAPSSNIWDILAFSGTYNIYDNLVGQTNSLSTNGNVAGIALGSTDPTSSYKLYYNTVYLNTSSTGTGFSTDGIYHSVSAAATTGALDMRNNIIVNTSSPAGAGVTAAYRRSGTSLSNFALSSNNNLLYAGTPSATRLIFTDGTNFDQTLAAYKARVSTRETNAVTELPAFLGTVGSSANFLHIDPLIVSQADAGGAFISSFTKDYDDERRDGTTPDIGADEFTSYSVTVTSTTGPSPKNYFTLKEAFDRINDGTHKGTVGISIFKNTQETAPAVLNASGTAGSSYTSIDITPLGNRVITGDTATAMIDLNGADNVMINGINDGSNSLLLSNRSVSSSAGTATIRLYSDAVSNTIKNCTIHGSSTTAVNTEGGTIVFGSNAAVTGSDNNKISGCTIGPAGTNLPSKALYAGGSSGSTTLNNSSNTITDNNVYDFFAPSAASAGLYIGQGNTNWTITNNRFYQTASRTVLNSGGENHFVIDIENNISADGFAITGNVIGFANAPYVSAAGAVSAGNTISVASTAGLTVGMPVVVTSGTGMFADGTTVSQVLNATSFISSAAPVTALNGGGTIITAAGTGTYTILGYGYNKFRGVQLLASPSASANVINGNFISNISFNTIDTSTFAGNYAFAGINIKAGINDLSVASNTIANINFTGSAYGNFAAVNDAGAGTGTHTIKYNNIRSFTSTMQGSLFGIYVYGPADTKVSGNNFSTFNIASLGYSDSLCMIVAKGTKIISIDSNKISGIAFTGTSPLFYHCIVEDGIQGKKTFRANNINNISNRTGNTEIYGICSHSPVDTPVEIYDNDTHTISNNDNIIGLHFRTTSGDANIYRNKIYDLTTTAMGSNAKINPISLDGGSTVTIYNNLIGDLKVLNGGTSNNVGAGDISGILSQQTTTLNIFHNTILLNATSASTTFSTNCVRWEPVTSTAKLNIRNNVFVNQSTPAGTGQTAVLSIPADDFSTYAATSNNNLFYAGTPSASNVILHAGNSASDQTLAVFKARVTPADANSISQNPTFLSTTGSSVDFLHPDPAVTSGMQNGGVPVTPPVPTDYDQHSRNGIAPDMGAVEYLAPNRNYWVGRVSSVWNLDSNWEANKVPGINDLAFVDGKYTNDPIITGIPTPAVNTLFIGSGGNVTLDDTLTVASVITSTGIFDASTGTIEFAAPGSSGSSLSGGILKNKLLKNLIVSGNVQLNTSANDTVKITGNVSFGNVFNKNFNTSDNLTLISNAAGTASIADITNGGANSGNSITGNAVVERFIISKRKWRFLSVNTLAGTGSKNSFQQNWMDGQTPGTHTTPASTGYGMWLTDATGTGAGFDSASITPNIKFWNGTGYTGISSPAADMRLKEAYMTFVRGDRKATGSNSLLNTTRLRSFGALAQNNNLIAHIISATGYTAIGNPYASAVDLSKLAYTNNNTTIYVVVWDPNSLNNLGFGSFKYLYKDKTGDGNFHMSTGGDSYPAGNNFVMNALESGQAFFIQGDGSATTTVRFPEIAKTPKQHDVFFTGGQEQDLFGTLSVNADSLTLTDGFMVRYRDGFSSSVDANDAAKIANTSESISIRSGGQLLAIEEKATAAEYDTVQINMASLRLGNYQWKFNLVNMDVPGRVGWLVDRMLGTETFLNLSGETTYDFTVTNATASWAADRFYIVFKPSTVVPVRLINITAARINKNDAAVNWRSENEINIHHYDIQRSYDGINFSTITPNNQTPNVPATNNNGGSASYNATDENVPDGAIFYRIKAVSSAGRIDYSAIAKLAALQKEILISVSPNPVRDKIIHLQTDNLAAGNYGIELIAANGQEVLEESLLLSAGKNKKEIVLNKNIAAGNYSLIIVSEKGERYIAKITVLK